MKVLRSTLAALVVGACLGVSGGAIVAAQDSTPGTEACVSTTVEENIATVHELYAAFENGDAETIDALLADEYTHNMDRFGLPDDPTSNADEIHLAMMFATVYPGSSEVVQDIFGSGDKVVVETSRTITGHMFNGEITELDTPIELRTIAILTFECGEIVSMNAMINALELMVELGVIELPEFAPVPES